MLRVFQKLENNKKLMLTFSLSVIGIVFLFVFGAVSFVNNNPVLGSFLFCSMMLGIVNIFLLNTKFKHYTNINLALIVVSINIVLLLLGGKAGTGLLWTYPLSTIGIAILKTRQGIVFCLVYLLIASVIFYFSNQIDWIFDYNKDVVTRYLFSSLAFCAITLMLIKIQENTHELLKHKTITDELTGLYNRSVLDTIKNQQAINNKRLSDADSICVMLLDIDFFKAINDTFGHSTGDKVLVIFSKILQQSVREDDTAIRWGGEEFLVFLKNCDLSVAQLKAKEIMKKVAENQTLNNIFESPMTLSVGISQCGPLDDIDLAIKESDKKLYLAKESGRNRVVA